MPMGVGGLVVGWVSGDEWGARVGWVTVPVGAGWVELGLGRTKSRHQRLRWTVDGRWTAPALCMVARLH
eukprot:5743434-Prymnesium_polylepis.1